MELAFAALGSLFTAAPAAGAAGAAGAATAGATAGLGAGAAAAGTAAAVAGIGSTALSILQGVAGVTSILAGLSAGNQEASALSLKAKEADIEAIREQSAGAKRVTDLKREMLKVLGENDVAFAAGGVDISAGVAADSRRSTKDRATREISIDRADTDARAAAYKARAMGYRRASRARRTGSVIGGLAKTAQLGFDIAARG